MLTCSNIVIIKDVKKEDGKFKCWYTNLTLKKSREELNKYLGAGKNPMSTEKNH